MSAAPDHGGRARVEPTIRLRTIGPADVSHPHIDVLAHGSSIRSA
jgi:hypothetical protein